jgi:enamine deaminase RidA (YjgF/YER057c/UK114 family)
VERRIAYGQPLHDGDMGAQVGQALDNLETVLGEAGCRPASTLLGVARLAIPSLLVEIEATAVK